VFLLLEAVLGPRLTLFGLVREPLLPSWLRVPVLLALALILIRWFGGVKLSEVGLYPWRDWSATERSYFIQVFILANVAFSLLYAGRLRSLGADPSTWGSGSVLLLTSLLWGFHQELVYRGILQTELVRRWGSLAGILVANSLYTFGPLHFHRFVQGPPARSLPMFAGIFAIGLFFSVLFRRSGNLWLVGIFHGIGNLYIVGLAPQG
jgi:membrane protease YdiL (CAAX protease family)